MKSSKLIIVLILAAFVLAGCRSPEMRSAGIAMNEKDWQRAIRNLNEELARNPGNPEAYYSMGLCYEKLNDWKNMATYYDSSLAVSDLFKEQIANNRKKRVSQFFNRGIDELDSAVWARAQDSLDAEALKKFDEERYKKALAFIDTAIMIDPVNIEIYSRAALIAYDGKQLDDARRLSMKAIELKGEGKPDISMREVQMLAYRLENNHEETVKWALEIMDLIDFETDDTTIYLRAVDCILEAAEALNKHDLGLEVTQRALKRLPENMALRENLAVIYVRLEDFEQAKKVYEEMLQKDPDDYNANFEIGRILYNSKNLKEAIPYLEKAFGQQPDNIKVVRMLMAIYYNTDQEQKGMEMKNRMDELQGGE